MQRLMGFSQCLPAITSATISSAFFYINRTSIYGNVFIPRNQSVRFSKKTVLKVLQTQCRASLEPQDASLGGTELQVHGLSQTVVGVLGGGQLGRMLCQAASFLAIKMWSVDCRD